MAPHHEFEREVERLVNQGCSPDQAIQIARQQYADLAFTAEDLLRIKERIARKRRKK